MRLKTIREQLLFAADYHHQKAKNLWVEYNIMHPAKRAVGKRIRREAITHDKMSLAIDAALKLL